MTLREVHRLVTREAHPDSGASAALWRGASPEFTGELRVMLRSALGQILEALACESGSIQLYDTRTSQLSLSEIAGPGTDGLHGQRRELSEGISGYVATHRTPLLIEDVAEDRRFAGLRNTARPYRSNSCICLPLLDEGKLMGVVNVCEKRSGKPFTEADLQRLQSLAEPITKSLRSGMAVREISEKGISLSQKVEEAARRLVQANFELAQMQGFHDSIVRSISLGLITFDRSLRITFFNDSARTIFGLTDSDLNIKSLQRFRVQISGGADWQDLLDDCVARGKAFDLRQIRCWAVDGRELLLNATCVPLNSGLADDGGLLVVEDVSRALQIERRIAQAEHHATIGKLAASVAHELNNPLDGVLRFTSMAMQLPEANRKSLEYLAECKKGLERMAKIVRSLLDYSRTIGKGLEDLDINELITAAVRNLRPLQLRNRVTVQTSFDEIPRARFANFSEVFTNVIRNAYEAMPMGGSLSITTELSGPGVLITFADTGKGVPEGIRKRIFEPFFTTKDTSESTGLGLAICHDIVSKHGGSIEVEDTEGHGATVRILVPL